MFFIRQNLKESFYDISHLQKDLNQKFEKYMLNSNVVTATQCVRYISFIT